MRRPATERFDANVERITESGCWIWMAYARPDGYADFNDRGRRVLVHRFAYERFVGAIPPGLFVLHRCDVPSCVNPAHLFTGTHNDNMADMAAKGRSNGGRCPPRGEASPHAKITADDVRAIRAATGVHREVAVRYGISKYEVSLIRRRKRWRHIT